MEATCDMMSVSLAVSQNHVQLYMRMCAIRGISIAGTLPHPPRGQGSEIARQQGYAPSWDPTEGPHVFLSV